MPPKRKRNITELVPVEIAICNRRLKWTRQTFITMKDSDSISSTSSQLSDLTSEVMIPLVNFKTEPHDHFHGDDNSNLESIIDTDILTQVDK